jgi:hypothetical protein
MNSLIELNIIQGGGDFFFKKPEESNQETYGQIQEANIIAKNWKKKKKDGEYIEGRSSKD